MGVELLEHSDDGPVDEFVAGDRLDVMVFYQIHDLAEALERREPIFLGFGGKRDGA